MITESELIGLSRDKFMMWKLSDVESITNLFDDHGLLICNSGKAETKPEIIQILQAGKWSFKDLQVQYAFARIYGTTAVVHGEGQLIVDGKGQLQSGPLQFLDVWVEREEGWKLVSSHLNQ
jgi:hypothetical protein